MTPEARRIARHHLGDRLHWIGRGGPHADLWIVQAWPDKGHMLSAQGATVDAAAADCAAQLRAGGWVPTHARLEWERDGDAIRLVLLLDKVRSVQLDGQLFDDGTGWLAFESADIAGYPAIVATMIAAAERWHAATAPSLHLPPFPGASDA